MNSLKILYVDTDRTWRGGQEQLFSLMLGIRDRQHQVWLAAPSDSPLSGKAQQSGIETYCFGQRSELSPWAFFQLWKILGKQDFDVIHLNTPCPLVVGGLVSKLCGIPLRVCSRRVNFPLNSPLSRLKYNWMQESVVTVSVSIRRTLIEGGVRPDLIKVIYEGVDLDWVDSQRVPAPEPVNSGLVVGTVAHLSPEKGHRTLLEAAARVLSRIPDVHFILVGRGELMSSLKAKVEELGIEKKVTFTGFRSDSEALMKHFDIFCLPSISEGLSSAILVAMATSLPVVATQVGGIPELVMDGKTGILVPPDDAAQLADGLCRVLESPQLREKMGYAGRQRIEEQFTLGRKLSETETLYFSMLASVSDKARDVG
jgi:glycosyltransferase involved in cell wall biosynthesis